MPPSRSTAPQPRLRRTLLPLLTAFLTITAAAQPANDNPCGAVTLTVGATCTNTAGNNSTATATSGVPAPGCANYQNRDVWYKLTVPANGAVSIQTTAGGVTNGGMAAYYATACNGTFTLIDCNDDYGASTMPQLDLTCLTPGATLYIRFWRKGTGAGGTFSICAVSMTPPAAPANDDPCGAVTLTAGASCSYVASTTVGACSSTFGGTPSCGTYNGNDTWYKVTTPSVGTISVTTTANSITNGAMAMYTATACNGTFTEVACDANSGPGNMPAITLSCVAAGTYYIRFWQVGGGTGTFNICATFAAQPSNDDPCGATVLATNAACSYVAGTNVGACNTTNPGTSPGCGNYNGQDVWYQVTTPSFGSLTLTTTAGTMTDGAMAIYTATSCNGTFTLVDCDDDSGPGAMPELTVSCHAAATYYVRMWDYGGGTGTFNICAVFTPTSGVPANDNPCSATSLTVGTSCSSTSGYNTCATNNTTPGSPGCGNFSASALDVWYSFTAPSTGIAIIETTAGTLTDASMALYSGTCSSLTLVECDADDGPGAMPAIFRTDLTPGNTYWIRVWGASGASGTFGICVRSPAMPTGYSCTWLFELYDNGGDGWGTSQISVSINGGTPTNYTVGQAYQAILIGVNIGQNVSVSYTNTGASQNDNSYVIRMFGSSLPYFNSGSPPGSGTTFTQTVNCHPPSQSQEDCLGAKTLCGSANENANPQSTGNVADLISSNYGCLASAERQGLWYVYRMTHGGNVGMTIAPAGNDDYDWAIWGPYPSNSTTSSICIPASAPARCSYASGTNTHNATGSYSTGMGSAAYSGSPQFGNPSPAKSQGSGGNGWVSGMITATNDIYLLYISNFSQSGLSFQLTWQLSNSASLDCTVLPVRLLTLSAKAEGSGVDVKWTTLSESHSDHFVVQRSPDGQEFTPIGSLEAAGNSEQRIDYAYYDAFPQQGANYYRLDQVDDDGAHELTETVVCFVGPGTEVPIVFPNPAQDRMEVSFSMEESGTAYLQVVDASGRVVRDRDMDLEHGANTVPLTLGGLSPGPYELRILTTYDQAPKSVRFIKE